MANLQLLTDEDILDYTRTNEGDNIITNHYDIDLTQVKPQPERGGIYDTNIFGSIYPNRCMCGKINPFSSLRNSKEPCPYCGVRVYGKAESLKRFGRIELPFYYLNDLRLDIFKEFFFKVFRDTTIKYTFVSDPKAANYITSKDPKSIGIKVFDSCQFNYNKKKDELEISEIITNESKCSYEGIMRIINDNFPDHLEGYQKLVNRYYLILPATMRPIQLVSKGGKKKLHLYKISTFYRALIRLTVVEDTSPQNYNTVREGLKTPGEKVRYTACIRAFINSAKKIVTELLNPSKENLSRGIYSVRTPNSARCVIIPDTEIAIDEIKIPTAIAYEMCREGFIKFLVKELNLTERQARESTGSTHEALLPETQRLFKEYAEKQIVLK